MRHALVRPRTFVRGLLGVGLALLAPAALAAGFQVSPTIAEVAPGIRVASFELRNPGEETLTIQVDALDWTQSAEGGDALAPARDVVIVPRLATLSPRGSQLVRIAVQGEVARERAYRLRLREVPPPPPPGFMGVRTLVEQLVPVFFQTAATADAVEWRVLPGAAGELLLAARNAGGRHLRLSGLRLVDPRGAVLAERGGPGYVLAGQSTQWPLDTHARPARGDAVRLEFLSHGEARSIPLRVE